jgi:tRNA pseudouridine38-40 synthase
MNYKITIAYDGRNYNGFQRQNNAVGVQNVIEEALLSLTGQSISIDGCSRTDTGVHAREFVFSFSADLSIPTNRLETGLNFFLPSDISVTRAEIAPEDFHARYSCKGKEYEYLIFNSNNRNPFYDRLSYLYGVPVPDTQSLKSAGEVLIGAHDFRSFCGQKGLRENTVRTIFDFDIKRENELILIKISGDGFLYNMVRIIVGTLLEINEGKRSPDDFKRILERKDRTAAGRTAPAEGLYLNRVFY